MISLVFLGYDHLKPTLMNRLFGFFSRCISPRWATVAVNINGTVYLWTPEELHLTTIDAMHEICDRFVSVVIDEGDDDVDVLDTGDYLHHVFGNPQRGRLKVIAALFSKKYKNCATLASMLIGERIAIPDRLYERVTEKRS